MLAASDSTPSTLRRMKSQVFASAFPTPPNHPQTDIYGSEMKASSTTKLISSFRAASTPPERPKARLRNNSDTKDNHSAATESDANWSWKTLSKKKSQYYDEAFACREPNHTTKSRAAKDSLITAEIKLNCCLGSEQEFLIDIAFQLSEIYQRPAGCIMVLVNTDFSILLNSSSEPAYQVSITALATEVAMTKNKRTTGIIQDFMLEALDIPASRGIFLFHVIAEENLVISGFSSHQELEKFGNDDTTDDAALKDSTRQRSSRSRKSSVAKPTICSKDVTSTARTRKASLFGNNNNNNFVSAEVVPSEYSVEKRLVRKRKSLMALLGF